MATNVPNRTEPTAGGILATAEGRVTAYYFVQYMTVAVTVVSAAIWFNLKGLNSQQIGIIKAMPVLVMLFLNAAVGRVADRARDWRQVIVVGAVSGGIIPIGLFFVHDFWSIVLVWTLGTVPVVAVVPVTDAATIRLTQRNGRTAFGVIRAWGTLGYTAALLVTGPLMTMFGGDFFVPLLLGFALLRAALALALPKFRAADHQPVLRGARRQGKRLLVVMKPWFLLPLVGSSIALASHTIFTAFQGLFWKQQGLSQTEISILIALGAAAEAALMFLFRHVEMRVSARRLILVSVLATMVRWLAMGFAPGLPLLVGLQLLHALTFALGFMGSVHFIAKWTSEEVAAEALGLFTVLQQVMQVVALLGFGFLVTGLGVQAYFVASAAAALAAALVWLSLRLKEPRGEADEVVTL